MIKYKYNELTSSYLVVRKFQLSGQYLAAVISSFTWSFLKIQTNMYIIIHII